MSFWPTMETTLALPRTIDRRNEPPRALFLKSRIGRRVVGLFVLSALVPLSLCAAILFRAFDSELSRTQQQSLDGLVRSFGMTLLGRLGSADDVLKVIMSGTGATDDAVQDSVAELPWARSVRRVKPWSSSYQTEQFLPGPDARQQQALKTGQATLLWGLDESGNAQVYLVCTLPSGTWLYTEIASTWLWSSASEFAAGAGLLVLDERGHIIAAAGTVPPELLRASPTSLSALPGPRNLSTTIGTTGLSDRWISRSWEVFLAGRYSSPSWHLVAIRPRSTLLAGSNDTYLYLCGFILVTILLISWLSMTVIRRQMRPLDLLAQATKRLAHRDFEAFRGMSWNDEFGDLARSFDTMSGKLKVQFAALETLADVDRLLLHTPKLEQILDTLLPRIASVLGCDSVSVLLFDPDSDKLARAYDFCISESSQLPVRRIATDLAALRTAYEGPALHLIDAATAAQFFAPIASGTIKAIRVQALKHNEHCAGMLCIGYDNDTVGPQDSGIGAADFADRLSLILANLEQSESLHRHANFDSLTGLQNRHLFSGRVCAAIAAAQGRDEQGGLLYLDLDYFKRVNDTAGHAAGDGLLRIVSERLMECAGEGHSIARLGGDEFAVLVPTIGQPGSLRQLAERIIVHLQSPIVVDGREHHVSASIGMTVFPADGTELEGLLRAGDIAMYQAKDAGRGRAVFFQAEMQQQQLERQMLESGMHRALEHCDFTLHYQPIVSEAAGGTLGVEALARWPGTDQAAWVSPAVFIPLAEENGIIVKLGEWILRRACEQFAQWRSEDLRLDYVSVNVSVRQLREPDYLTTLKAALAASRMQGKDLQVEITESVLAHGAELEKTLLDITALGVRLALDDFGTGYSSLSYLRTYPIHTVKIDRSFIHGLPHDLAACRLAESIIAMCAALDKNVVAEGVETEAQQQFLRSAGCSTIQGYLLGRPMEAADIPGFVRRLRRHAPLPGPLALTKSTVSAS